MVRYGFETTVWNVDNGLPQNSNQRVMPGGDGSVWMSGFGIPARFDGYAFQPAPLRGIPRGGIVHGDGLMPCPGGGLCAAVMGDGVWRMRGDSLADRIADLAIDGYARDARTGAIIVHTTTTADASLHLVGADTTYRLGPHPPHGIERGGLVALAPSGTLYNYSAAGEIWQLESGEWSLHSVQPIGFRTLILFSDANGTAWTMGEAGIHRITPDGLEPFSDVGWARHLIPYKDGYLVAAHGGIFRLSKGGSVVDTLATLHANWLYEDASGVVWAALESDGVMRLRPHRIGQVDLGDFGRSGVRSILRDRDGSVWTTGNCEGLVNFTPDGNRSVYLPSDEGLTPDQLASISNCLWTVAQTPDETVWTTGMGGRLHRIDDSRIRLADAEAGFGPVDAEGGIKRTVRRPFGRAVDVEQLGKSRLQAVGVWDVRARPFLAPGRQHGAFGLQSPAVL